MSGWIVPLACLAVCLGVVLWDRIQVRRTLKNLDRMLDEAIRGDFREADFDERLLSRVEGRMAEYLASSTASARNLQTEKDAVKTLIADVSHQTNTPIANLRLYVQLLEERPLDPESQNLVSALAGQTERLQTLVQDMVKASRLETGIITLHPKPNSLGPLLDEAAEQFAPKAAEKGVALTRIPTDVEAVFDPKWTVEAVCNLLDNAVKYTPPGGSVTLQVVAYELFCRIDVIDTGPGVAEEEKTEIFQRFYRSPAVQTAEGVGIGLYLTRKIAEGQGGYVKVFSKPGQGAKFSLFLPRK